MAVFLSNGYIIESKSIFVGPEKCLYVALIFESVLLDMEILVDGIFFFPLIRKEPTVILLAVEI